RRYHQNPAISNIVTTHNPSATHASRWRSCACSGDTGTSTDLSALPACAGAMDVPLACVGGAAAAGLCPAAAATCNTCAGIVATSALSVVTFHQVKVIAGIFTCPGCCATSANFRVRLPMSQRPLSSVFLLA